MRECNSGGGGGARVFLAVIVLMAAGWCGAQSDSIRFSHSLHLNDVGATCIDCHAGVEAEIGGTSSPLPGHDVCGACHQESIDEQACDLCHVEVNEARASVVKRSIPGFSHGPHIGPQTECSTCHAPSPTELNRVEGTPICHTCHDGRRVVKKCSLCHSPSAALRPASHTIGWQARGGHGLPARYAEDQCGYCHLRTFCSDCHQGRTGTRVHAPNYRTTHKLDVRRGDVACTVCHSSSGFCRSCH